jgi:hypothetical protein
MSHREGGGRPKIAPKKANIKAFLIVLKLAFFILNFYQSMMDMEKDYVNQEKRGIPQK